MNRSDIRRGGAKRSPSPWGVYFIGAGDYLYYVRVGGSEEVEEELKNLQERAHSPLTILGHIPGDNYVKTGGSTDYFYNKRGDIPPPVGWFERSLAMEEFLDSFEED